MDYTQKQLEEMVEGKAIDPSITFFDQALLDVETSKKENRRVYRNQLMIKRVVKGVTDYVAQRATAQDIKRWPAEYAAFQTQVQVKKSPGLEVIPGISSVEKQELIDRGMSTVARLAAALEVPAHLVHLQPMAQRINQAIVAEEQHHGNEVQQEESIQEESIEESRPSAVLTPHRRDDSGPVGQSPVPQVQPRRVEQPAQGNKTSGRYDGNNRISDDWKVDLTWRH